MISLTDLRAWLNIEGGLEHDSMLTALEARAVAIVQYSTGRFFGTSASVTEYLDGSGDETVWLADPPSAITSVSYRTELDGTWTAYTATTYEYDGRRLVKLDTVWPEGYRNLKAVYTRGYTAGAEPGDARQMVLDLVKVMYREGRVLTAGEQVALDRAIPGWTDFVRRYHRPLV